MAQLRDVSARPELVVDDRARANQSPSLTQVGRAGPLGRERVIYALPFGHGGGPVQLIKPTVLQGTLVGDPANNVIGEIGPVWVHRMLYARWTENTRRLG